MAYNNLQILNFNHNIVSLSNGNTLVITDNIKGNSISIPEPITHILQINSPGPQGAPGPSGSQGPSGSSGGGSQNLQQVLDVGAIATDKSITLNTNTNNSNSILSNTELRFNNPDDGFIGRFNAFGMVLDGDGGLTIDSTHGISKGLTYLNFDFELIKTSVNSVDKGLKLDFGSGQYVLGLLTDPDYASRVVVNGGAEAGNAEIQLATQDTNLSSEVVLLVDATNQYIKTFHNGIIPGKGLNLDFGNELYGLGDWDVVTANGNRLTIDNQGGLVTLAGNNSNYGLEISHVLSGKKVTLGNYGDDLTKIVVNDDNSTIEVTGSLDVSGSIKQNGADIKPYKVYTATLYQDGTSNPTATILENTLGFDITWTRSNTGSYNGTFSVEQDDRSKWFVMTGLQNPGSAPTAGKISIVDFYSNVITITTVNDDTPPVFSDGVLWQTPIEIRVYN